jgi:NAD(P)-dependent dehydrogenase (short-subunit alcohol dehydrogenase family)
MKIAGNIALVTGGASGLGLATVKRLHAGGASVAILDLPRSNGSAVAKELGERVAFAPGDVTNPDDVEAALDAAGALPGVLRILVNCAGIGNAHRTTTKDGPFPLDAFTRVIQVNLIGTFNVIRLAAYRMSQAGPEEGNRDGERGVIVNTASVAAFDGQIGQAAYSASKGGIIGMTLPAARDLSAIGVRVNTICPGIIDTPIYGSSAGSEEFKARLVAPVVFPKRMGRADEFAHLVLSLIGNDYLNADVVRFDGGIRFQPKL